MSSKGQIGLTHRHYYVTAGNLQYARSSRHNYPRIQPSSSSRFLNSSYASEVISHNILQTKLCSSENSLGSLSGWRKKRSLRTAFFSFSLSGCVPVTTSDMGTTAHFPKWGCGATPYFGGNTEWIEVIKISIERRICIVGGCNAHSTRTLCLIC